MFEVSNSYFVLDQRGFHQVVGIPIGSHGSPGYSMALCIFYEKYFSDSIADYGKLCYMGRYFDDLRVILAYKKNDLPSYEKAEQIIHLLSSRCYHDSMLLIPEKHDRGDFSFLEAKITISGGSLRSHLFSKNYVSLQNHGSLEVISSQTFSSFVGAKQDALKRKLGIILGRLAACEAYSCPIESLLSSFLHVYVQLKALSFPDELISAACFRKFQASQCWIWKFLAVWVRLHKRSL